MMGKSHLLLGSAGYLAIGVPVLEASGHSATLAEIGAGTVVAAGAAMLPDLDHPQATVARSLGPVTEQLSRIVAKIGGGHRNGTHSLLACFLVMIGSSALFTSSIGRYAALAAVFLLSSLVVRTLAEADGFAGPIISAIIAGAIVLIAPGSAWLIDAVVLGYALHLVGDVLTPEGVPPMWPVNKTRIRFPVIGSTGDGREKMIAGLCAVASVYLLITVLFVPAWNASPDSAAAAGVRSKSKQSKPSTGIQIKLPTTKCETKYFTRGARRFSGHDSSGTLKRPSISAQMVYFGYAKAAVKSLKNAEQNARAHKRGIWKSCA